MPHSQTRDRTNRKPSRTSSSALAPSSDAWSPGRAPMSRTHTAETANVAASNRNALPVPPSAMTQPAIAGPARRKVAGRTNWSSAFASARRSPGTSSGTIASKAGPKKAVAPP